MKFQVWFGVAVEAPVLEGHEVARGVLRVREDRAARHDAGRADVEVVLLDPHLVDARLVLGEPGVVENGHEAEVQREPVGPDLEVLLDELGDDGLDPGTGGGSMSSVWARAGVAAASQRRPRRPPPESRCLGQGVLYGLNG